MYGDEVVPLELEISYLCVSLDDYILNEEKIKMGLPQLEALYEKRVNALKHLTVY